MPRRRRKNTQKQSSLFDLEIHPETKIGILAIFLFLAGVLSILSFFGSAGQAGQILDNALAVLFGIDRIIFGLGLAVTAILLIKPTLRPKLRQILGGALLIISINAFIHILTFDYLESLTGAALGEGGGYVGLLLSYPFDKSLGFVGGVLALSALILVSLMLISHKFVLQLILLLNALIAGVFLFVRKLVGSFRKSAQAEQDQFGAEDFSPPIFESKELDEEQEEMLLAETKLSKAANTIDVRPRQRTPPIQLSTDLLSSKSTKPSAGDVKTNQLLIQKTLENFGIEVEMGEISVGPTVTQYTLKPAEGIKLARITALSNDLALALAAHPIRIEAPIPGKSLVGIEVPNNKTATVTLREVIESSQFKKNTSPLTIALGKDVSGTPWVADISRMPHMLIAGATGSGKTVCLNSIIVSLLFRNQPEDLKFILIDPKRVELPVYNGIPHLLTPVITEIPKTVNALRWTLKEMEHRFDTLSKTGKRDIAAYNKIAPEKMPYIALVIDELADLMVAAGSEVEGAIIRLAQMARAVGIHLIIATQRPSVDVITGLIKANITSRIAFAVASQTDSRTILDSAGAEKLLGRGDMLYTSAELSKPKRLQGTFVSDEEITKAVNFIKSAAEGDIEYNEAVTEKQALSNFSEFGGAEGDDPLFNDAHEEITRAGKASASLLQRRLKIGYARAARLLDIMEEQGIVGPADGAKPREVLLAPERTDTMNNVQNEKDFI